MAKIARKNMKIFGSTAGFHQRGVFGSLAAGSPAYDTGDPDDIQSLSNYLDGWYQAVVGNNSAALQDVNSLHFLFAYQLAYAFQAGVPEWNTSAIYYTGSLVMASGFLYVSLTDANTGNAITDATKWKRFGDAAFSTKTANYTATVLDDVIRMDTSSGDLDLTLPPAASSSGKILRVKDCGTNLHVLNIIGNAAELIDGQNSIPFADYNAVTLLCNGTGWDIL